MRATMCVMCVLLLTATAACGGDDDESCDLFEQTGCDDGFVCEIVGDGEPACFEPVVLRGFVFDLRSFAVIEGARVVAVDPNGAPISSVAVTDSLGEYDLAVPSQRLEDGSPVPVELTLRADAAGYQTFPSGLRQALPLDTADAVEGEGGFIVETTQTQIGLIELPDSTGIGTIAGDVEAAGAGVLVVAESGEGFSAIADRDGDYAIFNVPAGDYTVSGYAHGVNYAAVDVTVSGGQTVTADLVLSSDETSTITGTVQLVNPEMGEATSVVLVVASTFDDVLVRGATPPGLRAPEPGIAPNITGAFEIDGVPSGTYKILASFENDFLVRDPDTCIAGTTIVEQQVGPGELIDLAEGFKVTGAITVISPGAGGPEPVEATPVFSWAEDASAKGYDLIVFDSFGEIVWEHEEPDPVGDPSVTYAGPSLERGLFYQMRVTSWREPGGDRCEISQSEDLRGIFFLP